MYFPTFSRQPYAANLVELMAARNIKVDRQLSVHGGVQTQAQVERGLYSRGIDGRIDDTRGGWKGRALWTTYASVTPWAYEGGVDARAKAVKLQLRPNPLAK